MCDYIFVCSFFRETERVLEPLEAELEELEQQIKDQQEKNYSLKAKVLKNEELIQKKLTGIFSKKWARINPELSLRLSACKHSGVYVGRRETLHF